MNKDGRFHDLGRKKRTRQDEVGKITAMGQKGGKAAKRRAGKIREKRDFVA